MIHKWIKVLFGKGVYLWFVPFLLSACQTNPSRPPTTDRDPDSVVELDENTDPRFVSLYGEGLIGHIKVDGPNVFANNKRTRNGAGLMNGVHVRTGADSGARVELTASRKTCHYNIEGFRTGQMFGNTRRCRHNIILGGVRGRADQQRTRYLMSATAGNTVITLLSGKMEIRPLQGTRRRTVLRPLQEAVITPAGTIVVNDLDALSVKARSSWRNKYHFKKPPSTHAPGFTEAVGAALWGALLRGDGQRPSRPPRDGSSTQTPTTPSSTEPRQPAVVVVPNLSGKSLKIARDVLHRHGLRIKAEPAGAGSDYWVVKQNPSAGRKVKKGSLVKVFVSAPIK